MKARIAAMKGGALSSAQAMLARYSDQPTPHRLRSAGVAAGVSAGTGALSKAAAGWLASGTVGWAAAVPIAVGGVKAFIFPPEVVDQARTAGAEFAFTKRSLNDRDSDVVAGLRAEAERLNGRTGMWSGALSGHALTRRIAGLPGVFAHVMPAGLGGVGASNLSPEARAAALELRRQYNWRKGPGRQAFIAAFLEGLTQDQEPSGTAAVADSSPAATRDPDAALQPRGSPAESLAAAGAGAAVAGAAAFVAGRGAGIGVQDLGAALTALIDEVDRLRLSLLVTSEQVDMLGTGLADTLMGSQTGRDVLDAFDEARLAVDDAARGLAATTETAGDYLEVLRG